MQIKELVKILQKFDQEKEIWFSRDEEGNSYHPKCLVLNTNIGELGKQEKEVVVIFPLTTNEDIY